MLTLLYALLPPAAAAQPTLSVETVELPIRVDGNMDEAAWSQAAPVTDFTQFSPRRGGAPPGSTEVRFLQDEDHLYVGVKVSGVDYPLRARYSAREAAA